MKTTKLMCAALALVAFAACNKQEVDTVLSTSKKTVALTIMNGGAATRAITTASADANFDCASANDLTVLFADAAGKVVETRLLTNASSTEVGTADDEGLVPTTYSFHKLPETVQQVGVIALRENTAPASLNAAEELWKKETPDAEVANIVVYGTTTLTQNNTCEVDGENYPLFEGAVRVAPAHTRLEILSFQCTDLSQNEYGYSQITLEKMTYGSNYTQDLGKTLNSKDDIATAGDGKAWSWNFIAPETPEELVVDLTVVGKNYTVAIPEKTITINGYQKDGEAITEFSAENIYKLTVPFLEENIDKTDAYICVNVEVAIAKWVINTITPVFANPAN